MFLAPPGVHLLFHASGVGERHYDAGAEMSGSRGSLASDCSNAAPYGIGAARSEPPLNGHSEETRIPVASHGEATAAATAAAGVTRPERRAARSSATGLRTTERSWESASLMRPPRPPLLLLSERQPMTGPGRGSGRGGGGHVGREPPGAGELAAPSRAGRFLRAPQIARAKGERKRAWRLAVERRVPASECCAKQPGLLESNTAQKDVAS